MLPTDETHDPALRCWADGAEDHSSDFPIQNLPFGVFRRRGTTEPPSGGVAIGRSILDLAACLRAGLLQGRAAEAAADCVGPVLNPLLARGPAYWSALRLAVSRLLRGNQPPPRLNTGDLLVPMADADLALPVQVRDYTDFFASIEHATNAGRIGKSEPLLPPNYRHMPLAYHGRASTIAVSGTPCRRPSGQVMRRGADAPSFEASRSLDYELELAALVGPGNPDGIPIPLTDAEAHIFGFCLLNDWSARDIQGWEQRPLGPFLGKSFLTSVSPWIVTLDALAPFRVPARPRGTDDPPLLAYLETPEDRAHGGIDIVVEAYLQSAAMRSQDKAPARLSRGRLRNAYWTIFQMLAQHTSNGCIMAPGDLIASGTLSAPEPDGPGSLLELSDGGRKPLPLPSGETRRFLEDGDEVIFRAGCSRDGFARIGFGECRGQVAPTV
jgi:fumarylacetoacetase